MNSHTLGLFSALLGGSLWGFSGACGQFLFSNYVIDPSWLTALRMVTAGLILTLYSVFAHRGALKGIFASPRDTFQLLKFAIPGVMLAQYTYLVAISHTNAGTATVLQYTMPVIILAYVCLTSRRRPARNELAAMALALAGVFIIATHGNPTTMVLTPEGLVWGLVSAVTMAMFTVLPRDLMRRFGSVPVVGSGMLVGGLILSFPAGLWTYRPELDGAGCFGLFGIVILGTVVAFTLYLSGVRLIGAVKTSLLASVEPVAATALAVLWLGTDILPIDLVGFAAIIAAVVIVSVKD